MSGEKKHPTSSDMEYQYSDEDRSQESAPEPEKKPPFTLNTIRNKLAEKLPKKKKLRIIMFLLAAVYIVYKFLNTDETTPPPVPAAEKIQSEQLSKPVVKVEPIKPEPVVLAKPPTVTPSVSTTTPTSTSRSISTSTSTGSVKALNNGATAEQASQIMALQSSLDQMNQSIASLESSLLSLTGSVIGLSNKMTVLERMRQEEKNIGWRGRSAYYLHSLVPERAWLQSASGGFITVKVGDFIPGYGQVQKINLRPGFISASSISTSSGIVIYFAPNDS